MNGLTALLGLELLGLPRAQTLAVSGGAGILASYVIAAGQAAGLRVLADAKPEDEALVRGFGADVVRRARRGLRRRCARRAPGRRRRRCSTPRCSARRPFRRSATAVGPPSCAAGTTAETERGIVVHPVWVREVLERTDWLEQLRELASRRAARSCASPASTRPSGRRDAQRAMDAGGLRGRA